MSEYYILKDGVPVPCDLMTWAKSFEEDRDANRIGLYEDNGIRVSTVFLGLNHNFGPGDPILFETMIFGGEHDEYQDRYCTLEQAMAGHAKAVAMVTGSPYA